MKKLIIMLLSCVLLSGCSVMKSITAPFKGVQNSLPQQTDKSKMKDTCKGEAKFNKDGEIIYCSKGYYSYAENYAQKERKLSIKEKIVQFFEHLSGYLFWIVLALVFLCPSVLGVIFGRVIEGSVGIAKKTLDATVRAVQKARKQKIELDTALSTELDTENKKFIKDIKDKKDIK